MLVQDKVVLITNSTFTMPSVVGWSYSDVKAIMELLGIQVTSEGYGYVVEQSIPEGTEIHENDTLHIKLADKYDVKTSSDG